MPITFGCPSCERRFRVKDEWAGKRATCPGCQTKLTVPSPPDPPQQQHSAVHRASILAWLIACGCFLYAAVAIGTPLRFSPNALLATWVVIAFAIMALIGLSFHKISYVLGYALIALTVAVNIQVYSAGGPDQFRPDTQAGLQDWGVYLGVQVLNGIDVLDYLPESEFKLEEVGMQPAGTQAKLGAVALRGAVSLFLVGVVLNLMTKVAPRAVGRLVGSVLIGLAGLNYVWGDHGKAVILVAVGMFIYIETIAFKSQISRVIRLVFVILMLIIGGQLAFHSNWRLADYFLWPLDNVFRVLDFADAIQVFGWRLDSVEWKYKVNIDLGIFEQVVGEDPTGGEHLSRGFGDACGLLFRSMVGLYILLIVNYIRLRWLGGLWSDPQELAELATDPNFLVADAALNRLMRLGTRAKEAVPSLFDSLTKVSGESVPRIIKALNAADPQWREQKGHEAVVAKLVSMVERAYPDSLMSIPLGAVQELGRFGSAAKAAIPVLTEKLNSPNMKMQEAAAKALRKIGGKTLPC